MTEFPLVLTLDTTGMPQRWINYQDSCYYYSKDLVAWSLGQVEFTLHGGTCVKTGQQSTLTMSTIIAIRGKFNKQGKRVTRVPLNNRALFRRDRNLCGYCGARDSYTILTRDHVIPLSQGGLNVWTNVVTSCSRCNKKKDARSPEQAGMKLLYVPYEPNRSEYLILMNKRILFDQMEYLLKNVPSSSRMHQTN